MLQAIHSELAAPRGAMPCPECGARFSAADHRQVFCSREHQARFHDVMAKRGKVMLPLSLTARLGKNGKSELRSYAFSQSCALQDEWNREDRAAGRDPSLIVARKLSAGWRAADLGVRPVASSETPR